MYEQMTFSSGADFRSWLEENHDKCDGLWLVFGKTDELVTLSYDDALIEALCYGWIDGQVKRIDEVKYIRKFTPRRIRSNWSQRNKKIVAELIAKQLVMPSGLKAIERAKREGVWNDGEELGATDEEILAFAEKFKDIQPAFDNFMMMPRSVRKTYTLFYMDAKRDKTKINRLKKIVDRLNKNLKPM